MYRKKSSQILSVFILLVLGFTSYGFAIDFSNALKQSAQDTETAASLFAGKAQVGDLYNQALKIVKQNETSATDVSINNVVAYFTQKSCTITAQDVIHILYISNLWFKTFFDHMVLSSLTTAWSLPTAASINASYAHFFTCYNITRPKADDYTAIQKNLIELYYQSVHGNFYASTLAQDNVGEDLFRNGTLDDSNFDLLVDINALGDLLFASFKSAPEVLFYRLPEAVAWTNGGTNWETNWGINGGNNWWNNWWINGGTNTSWWVRGLWLPPSPAPLGSKVASSTPSQPMSSPSAITPDVDVQQFLTTNNPSMKSQSSYAFLVGNACADPQKLAPSQAAVQEITEDPQTYISGIISFVEHANSDELAQDMLLSWFTAEYKAVGGTNPGASIANTYAEIAFGEGSIGGGTCEAACLSLTGSEYIDCQLWCVKSCIQTCDDLPLDDKLLCVTDCSCKMISGPQGAWRDKIEDMFSIKFCKQPLQATARPAKKIVTNLEGILTSFVDALQGLKSSWQTTKMKKTKEFLDLGISLKLADLLDFKIFTAIKPIFAQKADAAKKRQQAIENATLAQATTKKAPTPESENYNKYVIVSDIAADSAGLEPVANADASKASFQALQQVVDASLQNPIALYQQQKSAFLSEDVINFLQAHIVFWDTFLSASLDMQQSAITLKKKIENSN